MKFQLDIMRCGIYWEAGFGNGTGWEWKSVLLGMGIASWETEGTGIKNPFHTPLTSTSTLLAVGSS